MAFLRLKTPQQMAEAVVYLSRSGFGHHVPLLRAAMAGTHRICFVPPGFTMPLNLLDMTQDRRPLIVVLQDDGPNPTGPSGFAQARRLLKWAASVLVHACGAEPYHYTGAVVMAGVKERLVLVETCTAQQAAWLALKDAVAPRTPGVVLAVRPGDLAHPVGHVPPEAVIQ